jgi:hypothetical protein
MLRYVHYLRRRKAIEPPSEVFHLFDECSRWIDTHRDPAN